MIFKGIIGIVLLLTVANTQLYTENKPNVHLLCPQLYHRVFRGCIPRGNTTAGKYSEINDVKTAKECVYACCVKEECNVAFMTTTKCFHIECASNELCVPVQNPNIDEIDQHISMVLVRPAPGQESWKDVFEDQAEISTEHIGREMYNMINNRPTNHYDDVYKDLLQLSESALDYNTACSVGIGASCIENEECVQNYPTSRAGTCKCKVGFLRNHDGLCSLPILKDAAIKGNIIDDNDTVLIAKKQLMLTAESKEVKLPENEVSLVAVVNPLPTAGEKFNYEWTSLRKPEGSGAVKIQKAEILHLTKLSEGLYTFKVNVSSEDAYGETFVNVTVLPPSRVNKPPQIIITPANQTIKLPNTGAVLDASSSTDDNGIVLYHWELQQGPVGYQPQLADAPTLQLKDLTRPGNYTFKLTVTDTDKAISTSTANITVLKVKDYPPDANAGQDVIIYLPKNQITLNGNLSTDDHMITTWEWTKSSDDADKAVDMQDTRTPYLRLSDLEKGVYTFQLKVTDSANQSSTASVHVFVKPPTNQPPIARAADNNITISLPQTWVVLDASNSTDDNHIVSYNWEKLNGPSKVAFVNASTPITNVTNLTKGLYVFRVNVTDDDTNQASAIQYVIVNQNKNQKPTANAGGNFELELPRNVAYLNGTKSSDDWAIVKWQWTRVDSSLAAGRIAEDSDKSSILILSDLVPGKYIFNLSVSDEQGLSDVDSITLTVKNDGKLFYMVDMTVDYNVKTLNEARYRTLVGKLALLVQDNMKLQVRELKQQTGTGKAIISFYVEDAEGKPVDANEVVKHLREKLKVDAGLLGFSVSLQTAICQNNCSGHGVCEEISRKCICEAFWMQDLFKVYLQKDVDSDCSWSILYVVLGLICSVIAFIGIIWGLVYLCFSFCSYKNMHKPQTYKLIEDTEDMPPYHPRKPDLTDTDSESDTLYEISRGKGRFGGESKNGYKPGRNAFGKSRRGVKA
ncbi:PREDICTED: dyslexia-associated protein KIAA0319-like protein [Nicrophorus vespilloides]|uniref:Dyslexia-associated protein KIAA0319-like protein n=1 Tax=Nicrophorus vespilloides TaxID=110193 RepID=A0ABM1N9C7_NICVS|nr:PREDICTED: dyslexia-associated protein KIAA0319-like protein [Nicrophorus vespilloides]